MWDLQRGKKGERPERVKRKVEDEDEDGKEAGSKRRRSLERYAPRSARHERAKDGSPTARERKHHHHRSENRRQEREKERSKSRSPARERKHHHHHHHHHRSKRSREHERDKARARSRSPDRLHHSSTRRRRDVQKEEEDEQSSSEAEIGPELPARGRGSQHASILDRPEEEEEEEGEAGGGRKTTRPDVVVEEDIANVKWTAMGQKREWDRGKEQDPFNIKSNSEEPEEMWAGRLK